MDFLQRSLIVQQVYRHLNTTLLFAIALLARVNGGDELAYLIPDLVLIFLFYQLSYAQEHFRVVSAWVVGLMVDVWSQAWLGENAFLFAFIAFLWQWSWAQLDNLASFNQGLIVGLCIALYHLVRTFNAGFMPDYSWSWVLAFAASIVIHCALWVLISWPRRLRI